MSYLEDKIKTLRKEAKKELFCIELLENFDRSNIANNDLIKHRKRFKEIIKEIYELRKLLRFEIKRKEEQGNKIIADQQKEWDKLSQDFWTILLIMIIFNKEFNSSLFLLDPAFAYFAPEKKKI